MNERRLIRIRIAAIIICLIGVGAACLYYARRPARYDLLDSHLGPSAWKPDKLLEILSWEYHQDSPNPLGLHYPDFFNFQYQALLRLIDIQQRDFGRRPPLPNPYGTAIDHTYVHLDHITNHTIVIIGTGNSKPDLEDNTGPYWKMERMTFSPVGELLSREAYIDK